MTKHSYSFRPRKQIQRQLIVDACQRLHAVAPLASYEYVGLGGYEFIDFELIRRQLGISRMVSYEDDGMRDRYEFNIPFSEIELKFGPASAHLPFLDARTLRIVWLDYVKRLTTAVLQDVSTAASRLAAGSVLLLTVNAVPGNPAETRRARLVEDVTEELVPNDVTNDTLAKWGLADVQRRILLESIAEALDQRGDGAEFEQFLHFRYADGAQMMTVGGMIVTPAVRTAFTNARFDELAHVSRDSSPVVIGAPTLTAKEALHLNRQLPVTSGTLECPGLTLNDLDEYERYYRWYPAIPAPF